MATTHCDDLLDIGQSGGGGLTCCCVTSASSSVPVGPSGPLPAPSRAAIVCGIAAPAAFIAGWLISGLTQDGYDPLRQHISQLARVGADTRPLMTAGFVGFGLLALPWSRAVAGLLDAPALRWSIGAAAVGTLAVGGLPLGASFGDTPHVAVATLSYVGMAASPLLGGRALARNGHRRAALASYAVSAVSAFSLVVSNVGEFDGFFQRLGLTVVDAWFVTVAVRALRRPRTRMAGG